MLTDKQMRTANYDFIDTRLTPPIHRFPIAYRPYSRHDKSFVRFRQFPSKMTLISHRILFFGLIFVSLLFGGIAISTIFSPEGITHLEAAIILIFTLLFGWTSTSFWMTIIGFISLIRTSAHNPVIPADEQKLTVIPKETQTAIVIPTYNEDPEKIFANLQAIYESLAETGELERFSFFILSDTTQPDVWMQEEDLWKKTCQRLSAFGRIFYRRRKIRIHKKSGNISDFCRRWGAAHKYMVVLDADSLMSGRTIVEMVKMMESRKDIGILQTSPKAINQKSLISRMQQFASHVYGPLYLAGLHFWQQDDAGFWGHNAIVRLDAFMEFCALPKLWGPVPLGGDILSHDFVEAALMRRAGWGVWLAYDLEDSYEELPPNLLAELDRDRRWCQGNLQHLQLMFMKGISFGHRLLFLNGNMFYFSSFLWFVLLGFMTLYSIKDLIHRPEYFPSKHLLFPAWPVQHQELSIGLLGVTLAFLFLPKVLSVLWIVLSGKARLYGGTIKLVISVILETFFSILLAPIRMLSYSWVFMKALFARKLEWKRQVRDSKRTSFREAVKAHWMGTVGALILAGLTFATNQTLFLWLSLVFVPLILAVPVSILLSYPEIGMFFQRWGLFLAPVETRPSKELSRLQDLLGTKE